MSTAQLTFREGHPRDLAATFALAERALQIQEKSLGPDHPDVAAQVSGLAIINW